MPTLYWGPWLAKIRRGGPEDSNQLNTMLINLHLTLFPIHI
jgi:hypothetical protein